MTYGDDRVAFGVASESAKLQMDVIRRSTAELIDLCHHHSEHATSQEVKRLLALAMTHYENAAMWAIKAITRPDR